MPPSSMARRAKPLRGLSCRFGRLPAVRRLMERAAAVAAATVIVVVLVVVVVVVVVVVLLRHRSCFGLPQQVGGNAQQQRQYFRLHSCSQRTRQGRSLRRRLHTRPDRRLPGQTQEWLGMVLGRRKRLCLWMCGKSCACAVVLSRARRAEEHLLTEETPCRSPRASYRNQEKVSQEFIVPPLRWHRPRTRSLQ